MKVTFDGSYKIPSSVSHPAMTRHRSVTGLNSDPSQVTYVISDHWSVTTRFIRHRVYLTTKMDMDPTQI
uniref:Uncharacterized protein n=1 Tax=Oryza sativa subsp. japonica TaxID=39947 RepID=Q33BI8_ORYSJ|nr:hypothetical protein LOC_Os10g01490 [Oryza sativa Japonica Group]